MEGQEQWRQIRVVKIESMESWNSFVTKAAQQGSLIVVHFTASWCMPSVAMNPFFEELAFNYQMLCFSLLMLMRLSSCQDQAMEPMPHTVSLCCVVSLEVAAKMEIKAMPTFLLMKNGTQIGKLVGANPEEVRKMIDANVETIHVA
ncbi:Thioredoxin-like protein CXXS1 [Cucurbita argyrosperma subsp. argyrosperma]|nr:Thioredoxin-like protein CXXS1 [Cucurbita argyrosperma subsp. argyrosperma]